MLTQPQIDRFLESLANTCNTGRACEAAGISRSFAFRQRKINPEFAAAWDAAEAVGVTVLEDEAKRRAFEGVDEPLTYQGAFMRRYETRLDPSTGEPFVDLLTGGPQYFPVYDTSGRHAVETVKKFSDSLVALLLKAHAKEKYRDRSEVDLIGNVNLAATIIAARKRTGLK